MLTSDFFNQSVEENCKYGRYYCTTDKKYKCRQGPKQTRTSESVTEEVNPIDTVEMDVPLLIRALEYAREDAKDDMDLHKVVERMIAAAQAGEPLNMDDYNMIFGDQEEPAVEVEEAKRKKKKKSSLMSKPTKRGYGGYFYPGYGYYGDSGDSGGGDGGGGGESRVNEAEADKTINNQKFVDLLRKAREIPVTGLNPEQRIQLALADQIEQANDKIDSLQQQNQQLVKQVTAKTPAPVAKAAQAAEPAKAVAQTQAAPAAQPQVQQVTKVVTQFIQQAAQDAKTPAEQAEAKQAEEQIREIIVTNKMSKSDLEAIERAVTKQEKNGIKFGDIKRLLRTIDKRSQQTKQEKEAEIAPAKTEPAELPANVISLVDRLEKRNQEQDLAIVSLKQDLDTARAQVFNKLAQQQDLAEPEQQTASPAMANMATALPKVATGLGDTDYAPANDSEPTPAPAPAPAPAPLPPNVVQGNFGQVPQLKKTGTLGESVNEQMEAETFDFRLPAARVVGVVDDFFSADWNKVFLQFKSDYDTETDEEDPSGEANSQLEKAFYYPMLVDKKMTTLAGALNDLLDYHTQIYNHQEYKAMFGQVMFPAFQGKIYGGSVKSKETNQNFDNDYEFFMYYKKLISKAIRDEVNPFMRNVNEYMRERYAENTPDSHAMSAWYLRNVVPPYKKAINDINTALQGLDRLAKAMFSVLPQGTQTQGELLETRRYYRTHSTDELSLKIDFGLRKDHKGWYLPESVSVKTKLDVERAFGEPIAEMNLLRPIKMKGPKNPVAVNKNGNKYKNPAKLIKFGK